MARPATTPNDGRVLSGPAGQYAQQKDAQQQAQRDGRDGEARLPARIPSAAQPSRSPPAPAAHTTVAHRAQLEVAGVVISLLRLALEAARNRSPWWTPANSARRSGWPWRRPEWPLSPGRRRPPADGARRIRINAIQSRAAPTRCASPIVDEQRDANRQKQAELEENHQPTAIKRRAGSAPRLRALSSRCTMN